MANKTNNGRKGGWLVGKRHDDKKGNPIGGIPAVVGSTKKPVELEGGEVIINREASKKHWKELSRINQSAGGGVPIKPQDVGADADVEEYKEGGKVIEFNPNDLPNKLVYTFAKKLKEKYPKVWKKAGNIFGNEAFNNLDRVIKRGYWLDSEEWMYIKWRSYVARHKKDFRLEGVIAMIKWVDTVDKGWAYMKELVNADIEKEYSVKNKMKTGGSINEEVYIEFLNKQKGFKKDIKYFKSYEDAVKWGKKTFEKFNQDMIKYKMKTGGELTKGSKVEKEHKDTIEKVYSHKITPKEAPRSIAKEHLKENPKYYTELAKIEKKFDLGGPVGNMKELWYVTDYEDKVKNISTSKEKAETFLRGPLKNSGQINYIKVPLADWNNEKVTAANIKQIAKSYWQKYSLGGPIIDQSILVESNQFPGQFTIGPDDGKKVLYTQEEIDLINQYWKIRNDYRGDKPASKIDEYIAEIKEKENVELTKTFSKNEFGNSWKIWQKFDPPVAIEEKTTVNVGDIIRAGYFISGDITSKDPVDVVYGNFKVTKVHSDKSVTAINLLTKKEQGIDGTNYTLVYTKDQVEGFKAEIEAKQTAPLKKIQDTNYKDLLSSWLSTNVKDVVEFTPEVTIDRTLSKMYSALAIEQPLTAEILNGVATKIETFIPDHK